MQALSLCANPFLSLIDPEAVLRMVGQSLPLSSLSSQIVRKLDDPEDGDFDEAVVAKTAPAQATAPMDDEYDSLITVNIRQCILC